MTPKRHAVHPITPARGSSFESHEQGAKSCYKQCSELRTMHAQTQILQIICSPTRVKGQTCFADCLVGNVPNLTHFTRPIYLLSALATTSTAKQNF